MGHQTTEFLLRHGYGVVFAWVFAEQMGIPVPALPLLLAAGAAAATLALPVGSLGRASLATVLYFAVLARTGALPSEVTDAARRLPTGAS